MSKKPLVTLRPALPKVTPALRRDGKRMNGGVDVPERILQEAAKRLEADRLQFMRKRKR